MPSLTGLSSTIEDALSAFNPDIKSQLEMMSLENQKLGLGSASGEAQTTSQTTSQSMSSTTVSQSQSTIENSTSNIIPAVEPDNIGSLKES